MNTDLNPEQQAFFDHQLRYGPAQELVQRREALRASLLDGSIGYNRKAALLAIGKITERISPTPESGDEAGFIQVAQRLRNGGDECAAERLLESAGMDMEELNPIDSGSALAERISKAQAEFRIERDKAINKLQVERKWSKRRATNHFFGRDQLNMALHPDAPQPEQRPDSLADALRKQTNRNHALPVDRPIG